MFLTSTFMLVKSFPTSINISLLGVIGVFIIMRSWYVTMSGLHSIPYVIFDGNQLVDSWALLNTAGTFVSLTSFS